MIVVLGIKPVWPLVFSPFPPRCWLGVGDSVISKEKAFPCCAACIVAQVSLSYISASVRKGFFGGTQLRMYSYSEILLLRANCFTSLSLQSGISTLSLVTLSHSLSCIYNLSLLNIYISCITFVFDKICICCLQSLRISTELFAISLLRSVICN